MAGKKVIFTSGCFDILHLGHIDFFELVRKWGGRGAIIIVGVEPDKYLQLRKGRNKPIFTQDIRIKMLSKLLDIDYVIKDKSLRQTSEDHILYYKKIAPKYIVFGNTEKWILDLIKQQAKEASSKFKHLPRKTKLESTSRIARLIFNKFST